MVQNSIYLENEFYGLFEFFLRFFIKSKLSNNESIGFDFEPLF